MINDTIISNNKNIATNYEICKKNECAVNCTSSLCEICLSCINEVTRVHMLDSYREQAKQGNFKRIFPSTFQSDHVKNLSKGLSNINHIMLNWYKAKCNEDEKWCQ